MVWRMSPRTWGFLSCSLPVPVLPFSYSPVLLSFCSVLALNNEASFPPKLSNFCTELLSEKIKLYLKTIDCSMRLLKITFPYRTWGGILKYKKF